MADARKTDRRTVYTKKAIGDAFLRVKRNKDYNAITVADICREAEISRLRYGLGGTVPLTQREIASSFGISRSYVSRRA